MNPVTSDFTESGQLRRLRLVSLLEGVTLVILVFVAVPLKHLAGYGFATATMGPIHGMAFLLYSWMLAQTAAFCRWPKGTLLRLFILACIPFGAFANERWLRHKLAAMLSDDRRGD